MDTRIDPGLAEQPAKRRGRAGKALPDADSRQAIPDVLAEHGGQRQTDHGSEPGPVLYTWASVSAFAAKLSESGLLVTQLHTTGKGEPWAFWGVGAATHSHSNGDYVVTSDGAKHII